MDITNVEGRDSKKIEIFCCYARRDQSLLLDLKVHLSPLQREGLITLWADVDINAGTEWENEIHQHLNTAHIVLLLVSPDFMASDYCYSVEIRQAMERHKQGNAQVIPIIVRPTDWQNAPFSKLQALPKNAIPIISSAWHTQDDAFLNIVEGIRRAVEARLAKEEKRRKAKQVEPTYRMEEKKPQKGAEEKKALQVLEQEELSHSANITSTILKIEPIRFIFCLCTMSIGIFTGIFLASIPGWSNDPNNYLSTLMAREASGIFIAIMSLFVGFAFIIGSQSARVNILKGSILIFMGNVLLIFSLQYNFTGKALLTLYPNLNLDHPPYHFSNLPLWLMCTHYDDVYSYSYMCTSTSYFPLGIIAIVLCVCIILFGGWFFCQQANATVGMIGGSLIIITGVGVIALLITERIVFLSMHEATPPDLSIPIYFIEIIFGIALIFITRRNKARI